MQAITGSVGEGGTNNVADVALVQAMLVKITRPAAPGRPAAPYLSSYDGSCGKLTKAAIKAFQADRAPKPAPAPSSNPPLAPNLPTGLVRMGDVTWAQLLTSLPVEYANMRVLAGSKIVYLQGTANELQDSLLNLSGLVFESSFRAKVKLCIEQTHKLHGIVLRVCSQGDRRTFQAQYQLFIDPRGVTGAGPGESNHNYGMAVDLGFAGLKWLHPDGAVDKGETAWLHHLDKQNPAQAGVFWSALRTVGTSSAVGAFRGPVSDFPHLQNWDDANVSMRSRLAAHLQSTGSMRWATAPGGYLCDLGLGGQKVAVGTAAQIWNLQATLTVLNLSAARAAAAAAKKEKAPAASTEADVTAVRQALREQFDLADANWERWTAQ